MAKYKVLRGSHVEVTTAEDGTKTEQVCEAGTKNDTFTTDRSEESVMKDTHPAAPKFQKIAD